MEIDKLSQTEKLEGEEINSDTIQTNCEEEKEKNESPEENGPPKSPEPRDSLQDLNQKETHFQLEANKEFQSDSQATANQKEEPKAGAFPWKDLAFIVGSSFSVLDEQSTQSQEPSNEIAAKKKAILSAYRSEKEKPKSKLTNEDLQNYKTMATMNFGPPPGAKMRFQEMKTWEYLLYRDFREYQFYIVETSLFFNTLVSLPTGLGKTFIAVNVMSNYYRWFENGKIFFLAPSKPLVSQQMAACLESEAFKTRDLLELTGETQSENRKRSYERGRVFFMTPQTLENDIDCERIDLEKVVLVVYGTSFKILINNGI